MVATNEEARTAILHHHEELVDGVRSRVAGLADPVAENQRGWDAARAELVAYLASEVLPHAAAEEATLYRAAVSAGLGSRIEGMTTEHRTLEKMVSALARSNNAAEADASARGFEELFSAHVTAENDIVLPALMSAVDVSLADLLSEMHEAYSAARSPLAGPTARAKVDPHLAARLTALLHRLARFGVPQTPQYREYRGAATSTGDAVLDVRDLAPAQRHQAIFNAYAALDPAAGFVLVNDHDPKPLHYQLAAEHPDEFTWDYLESGPRVWRVRIGRAARAAA